MNTDDNEDIGIAARRNAQLHWGRNPCGAVERDESLGYTLDYFLKVESQRYKAQPWMQAAIWQSSNFAGKKILEIGVGHGTDQVQFAKQGAICHGIDITERHLSLCEMNFHLRGYSTTLKKCDATAIDFPDATFDVVYSFGVLHHVPEIEACFAEIGRVLKPGGRIIIAVYNEISAFWIFKVIRHGILRGGLFRLGYRGLLATIEDGADGVHSKPYVRLYRKNTLRKLVEAHFSVDFIKTKQLVLTDILSSLGGLVPAVHLKFGEEPFGWYLFCEAQRI